jgi:hypothetical protein
LEARKADPAEDARLIAPHLKGDGGRRLVKKMNTPDLPAALDKKPPHAMSRKTMEIVFGPGQRNTHELDEPFATARQVLPQPQETYTVLAKAIQADGNGSAIGPQRRVAFDADFFVLPVARRIPAEKYG